MSDTMTLITAIAVILFVVLFMLVFGLMKSAELSKQRADIHQKQIQGLMAATGWDGTERGLDELTLSRLRSKIESVANNTHSG